jgi:hypothetical protein
MMRAHHEACGAAAWVALNTNIHVDLTLLAEKAQFESVNLNGAHKDGPNDIHLATRPRPWALRAMRYGKSPASALTDRTNRRTPGTRP